MASIVSAGRRGDFDFLDSSSPPAGAVAQRLFLRRALSIRMRRMASAAAPKNARGRPMLGPAPPSRSQASCTRAVGLQGLAGRFVGHLAGGELAQLLIDHRQQFVGGPGIALFDRLSTCVTSLILCRRQGRAWGGDCLRFTQQNRAMS